MPSSQLDSSATTAVVPSSTATRSKYGRMTPSSSKDHTTHQQISGRSHSKHPATINPLHLVVPCTKSTQCLPKFHSSRAHPISARSLRQPGPSNLDPGNHQRPLCHLARTHRRPRPKALAQIHCHRQGPPKPAKKKRSLSPTTTQRSSINHLSRRQPKLQNAQHLFSPCLCRCHPHHHRQNLTKPDASPLPQVAGTNTS